MKDSLTTTYDSAKNIIRKDLESMSKKFITIGYYLKYIRDKELYKQDSFSDIWEFAQNTYGISKSTCSRWMSMNDKFSKGGNSPYLKEELQSFGKSQLQEMLYLTEEQMEQAKPEMTAKEIREIRKPEKLSAYGTKKKIYPEGSLLTTKGCEGGHDCFSCGMECGIRQEDRYCQEAPIGNPFICTTMNALENLKQELGSKCQFINQELAYHRPGDGEAVPCCKECENPCGYECNRSLKSRVQIPGQQSLEDCPEFLPDKTTEEAEYYTGEVVESKKKEEHTDCPPGISDCIRQQWGTSSDEQHEGQKECAKCWENWKKLHSSVEKEESVAPPQQEEAAETAAGTQEALPELQQEEPERCENAAEEPGAEEREKAIEEDIAIENQTEFNSLFIKDFLFDKENELNQYLQCEKESVEKGETGFPVQMIMKQQAVVDGLKLLLERMEDAEPEEQIQPELPTMKNNDQRKAFIDAYDNWPVWIDTKETGERYYRYDFQEGSSFVVKVYFHKCFDYSVTDKPWKERYTPKFGAEEYYLLKDGRYFKDCLTNKSTLIDFLKEVQKK